MPWIDSLLWTTYYDLLFFSLGIWYGACKAFTPNLYLKLVYARPKKFHEYIIRQPWLRIKNERLYTTIVVHGRLGKTVLQK